MDSSVQEVLLAQFVRMLDEEELHCAEPEQFDSHWDNHGKPGLGKVIQVGLEGQPCEMRLTLFFDGPEVVKTGVLVKYRGESIINEVRLGDAVGFLQKHQRVDVIGYLRQMYGSAQPSPAEEAGAGGGDESFALMVDQDSENLMMQAVMQLTGRTEADLRAIWNQLLQTNPKRTSHTQVSPFIKIWLRKERTQLDRMFLDEAWILRPRDGSLETGTFNWVVMGSKGDRAYTVELLRMTGAQIKEKAAAAEAHWWNGMYWGLQNGRLARLPEETGELEKQVRGLNSHAFFEVEKISINGRTLYWVILEGRARTMVWRAEVEEPMPPLLEMMPEAVKEQGKLGKLMGRLVGKGKGQESHSATAGADVEPPQPTAAEQFHLAHAERLYVRALLGKGADLDEARGRYIGVLYESDPTRFFAQPADLRTEMLRTVKKGLAGEKERSQEMTVVEHELRRFFGG